MVSPWVTSGRQAYGSRRPHRSALDALLGFAHQLAVDVSHEVAVTLAKRPAVEGGGLQLEIVRDRAEADFQLEIVPRGADDVDRARALRQEDGRQALEDGERFAGIGRRLQELRELVQARRRPLAAVEAVGHRVERARQASDLVLAVDDGALGEPAALQGFGSLGDRSERQQQVVREAERQRDAEQRRR